MTATGSAGTQGGLIVGLKAMESDIPLLGIGVNVPRDQQEQKVYDLACETAEFIGKRPYVNSLRGVGNRNEAVDQRS